MGQPDCQPAPSVSLTPPGAAWPALARAHAATTASHPAALAFRREIGLATDGPVVMSGHQAQWWHAGILAKQVALAAVCRTLSASAAWVVVDQDASDSLALSYPKLTAQGTLPQRALWPIAPDSLAAHLRADVAIADLPPFTPSPAPADGATPDILRGLRAIHDCTARWSSAANAAEQIARANAELAATVLGQSPTLIFATRLARTAAMRSLVEKMIEDPAACVNAYNRAVEAVSVHGIAPMSALPAKGRYELPLWQLSPRSKSGAVEKPSPRKRVFAHTLGDVPLDSLAPRGVAMTALLRWLGCDLFIHGLGGGATGEEGGYDKVAELWMHNWLGVKLAPSVVATATVLLPMGQVPTASEQDLRAAQRRAHAARHAPALAGDAQAQQAKEALVARIAAAKTRPERLALYRELQALLQRHRDTHAPQLAAAAAAAAAARSTLTAEGVLRERTWPWALLPRTALLGLNHAVEAAFNA